MPRHYVIQLDSDILCLDEVNEMVKAADANRPFALADSQTPGTMKLRAMTEWSKRQRREPRHIQVLSELTLGSLQFERERHYVRATAALVGFPKGPNMTDLLRSFSDQMWSRLGTRWTEWGSEQVASNFLVANSGTPELLVPPKYVNFSPRQDMAQAELVHFFGTHRYKKGVYANFARRVVGAYESRSP